MHNNLYFFVSIPFPPYHLFLYPFPNYWMFRIFKNIFIDSKNTGDFWLSCGAALAISVIILIVLMPFARRRTKIK